MQETHNMGIKAGGVALSGAPVIYLSLIYIGVVWVGLIVLIPLMRFFPVLKEYEWVTLTPTFVVWGILLFHMLSIFYTVILEPDAVTLKWLGISVRSVPVSRFKTFCAVGNEREDALCLSCYSVEEMAQMQQRWLLRSFLHKHDVPFRKRKADWQDDFAREYLNLFRSRLFSMFREPDIIMLEMQPALQYAIRQMYPQLPYMNYTEVTSHYVPRFSNFTDNKAVCFSLQLYEYRIRMEPDGIHICTRKEEVSFLPASQIKTAVRVDIFKANEKHYPHHILLLFITSMSEEELSSQSASRGYGGFRVNIPANQALMSMTAATYLALHWTGNKKDSCAVYHTKKNLETIPTLYPHIQINDIAANWLENSVEPNR